MSFYSSRGQTIHYQFIDRNQEHTLVFIHSLGTDFRIWDEVAHLLLPCGNALLYDLRGHGLSDIHHTSEGLHAYGSDLMDLIDFLGIKKNIIPIGISVGGLIAQWLAAGIPGSVTRLILCDTGYKIGTESGWNERINKVNQEGLSAISRDVVNRWFSSDYPLKYPERVRGYKNMLERTTPQGYVQTCEAIRDADTGDLARNIRIPTLCLVGAEDRSTTPEDVKNLAGLIPGSKYAVIENSGHLPCLDNPEPMAALIQGFIKEQV